MKLSIVLLIILILLFILALICIIIYNKFQDSIIRLNEVESKIDETLRRKFDAINEMNNIIKNNLKNKKDVIDDLDSLKKKNISNFDLDRKLLEYTSKINFVINQYNELHTIKELNKLSYDIEEMDEALIAYRKFYNENIVSYNTLIKKFPYNIIGFLLKYSEKRFFDNKNLNDNNIKDFKL